METVWKNLDKYFMRWCCFIAGQFQCRNPFVIQTHIERLSLQNLPTRVRNSRKSGQSLCVSAPESVCPIHMFDTKKLERSVGLSLTGEFECTLEATAKQVVCVPKFAFFHAHLKFSSRLLEVSWLWPAISKERQKRMKKVFRTCSLGKVENLRFFEFAIAVRILSASISNRI